MQAQHAHVEGSEVLAATPPEAALPQTPQTPARTWPAVLTLVLFAPIVAEMMSGSTPPLVFLQPVALLAQTGLYGAGALLAREHVRRRGLGWSRLLLLGAAYGILEEGLVISSWFNPAWPDVRFLGTYGRALETNWLWALALTMYHAVVSIVVPVVLAEATFPRLAARPWLRRRGLRWASVWLVCTCVLLFLGFNLVAYRAVGYSHPPVLWLGALALALWLVWLALRPTVERAAASPPVTRRAPHLWTLRLTAFAVTVGYFVLFWGARQFIPTAAVAVLLLAGLAALGIWRVARWSRRAGWGAEHRLALASGVVGFFVAFSPIGESAAAQAGKPGTGMMLVAVVWLVLLIVLARRAGRAAAHA